MYHTWDSGVPEGASFMACSIYRSRSVKACAAELTHLLPPFEHVHRDSETSQHDSTTPTSLCSIPLVSLSLSSFIISLTLVTTTLEPLTMGTRGIVGFIQKGVYKGCYNHYDSYPSGLGDAIILFILGHTDGELEEMRDKVGKVSTQALLLD